MIENDQGMLYIFPKRSIAMLYLKHELIIKKDLFCKISQHLFQV